MQPTRKSIKHHNAYTCGAKPIGKSIKLFLGLVWVSLLSAQITKIPFDNIKLHVIRDANEPEAKKLPATVPAAGTNKVSLRVRLIKTYEFAVQPLYRMMAIHRSAAAGSPPYLPFIAGLYPNCANPFKPTTVLRFNLPGDTAVSLKILNVRGDEVMALVEGERKAGSCTLGLEAGGLPSSTNFANFRKGDYTHTHRLVLAK